LGGAKESWQIFPFNSDLNCIIGGRGVGKSTLIQYISALFKSKISKQEYCFLGQAKYALVYFCIDNEIFCIKGELKPIRDSYTGEWGVEYGKQSRNYIDIQKEITLYKISKEQDMLKVRYVSKARRINILNELKLESYYQTEIESIGENPDKVNDWFEKFVTSRENQFSILKSRRKKIKDKLISNGKNGEIYLNGSIDKSRIISFIVEHMEGGKIGLEMRLKKYVTTDSVNYKNIFS